jgi:hypothetical protein
MPLLTRFFVGHPIRVAIAAVALLVAAWVAWYLISPLWIRTTANEALPPAATAAAATAAPATAAVSTPQPSPAGPVTLRRGDLGYVDPLHNGTGPVLIVDVGGRRFVRFENVAITNAPDIHVYLSRDSGGRYVEANTIYLGRLTATNGSFNYELPQSTDVAAYRSVVVWCRQFATLITWADLR